LAWNICGDNPEPLKLLLAKNKSAGTCDHPKKKGICILPLCVCVLKPNGLATFGEKPPDIYILNIL